MKEEIEKLENEIENIDLEIEELQDKKIAPRRSRTNIDADNETGWITLKIKNKEKETDMQQLIYLASPYSHADDRVIKYRYEDAMRATIWLMQQGYQVFSPIVYSHQLAEAGLGGSWEYWAGFDLAMIDRCDELWILELDGWLESVGVEKEREYALAKNMPIKNIDYCGFYYKPSYQFKKYNKDLTFTTEPIPKK